MDRPAPLLIFTEYDDTKRYLINQLRAALAGTDLDEQRIEVFHGPTLPEKRDAIKRALNLPPHEHSVRILVATDAAREGLNLQAHCHHLFHFDVPWNPSRTEQRNGRIDRKLQPAPVVYCHYFVYNQRPEDRVLQALVRKTKTIREELGSLSQVLEDRLADSLRYGIRRTDAEKLAGEIDAAQLDSEKQQVTDEELEINRDRREALQRQIDTLRNRLNDARKWIGLDNDQLRDAISCSLEMLGAEALETAPTPQQSPQRFGFPNLDTRRGADPTWATTLDTVRKPTEDGKRGFQWRRSRPFVRWFSTRPKALTKRSSSSTSSTASCSAFSLVFSRRALSNTTFPAPAPRRPPTPSRGSSCSAASRSTARALPGCTKNF
jgi:superfamily II DNA/RNA helicase